MLNQIRRSQTEQLHVVRANPAALRTWFLAIYLVTKHKNGIWALVLRWQLSVPYKTAWLFKHKLMQTMFERDGEQVLGGIVQNDDTYWGGERHGGGMGRSNPDSPRSWRRYSATQTVIRSPCGWTKCPRFAKPC